MTQLLQVFTKHVPYPDSVQPGRVVQLVPQQPQYLSQLASDPAVGGELAKKIRIAIAVRVTAQEPLTSIDIDLLNSLSA